MGGRGRKGPGTLGYVFKKAPTPSSAFNPDTYYTSHPTTSPGSIRLKPGRGEGGTGREGREGRRLGRRDGGSGAERDEAPAPPIPFGAPLLPDFIFFSPRPANFMDSRLQIVLHLIFKVRRQLHILSSPKIAFGNIKKPGVGRPTQVRVFLSCNSLVLK